MPTYCFKCDICLRTEEVVNCPSDCVQARQPVCCQHKPMRRDWHAEQFGGVTHRSKGVYPMTDIDFPGGPKTFGSYQEHKRELSARGLTWKPNRPESAYRRKHARDIK